jgi:hypothetical protein
MEKAMRSVVNIGPVSVRLSRKGVASWGYPTIRIGGLSLFSRSSNGDMHIAGYHPRKSSTWLWHVSIGKRNGDRMLSIAKIRRGQWHDYFNIGGFGFSIGHQKFTVRRNG